MTTDGYCPWYTLKNLCVTPDSTRNATFRVLQQQYGDGYLARRQDGLNPVGESWNVNTPYMTTENAYAMEEEIIALGSGFFEWDPPNEKNTPKKKWILDPYNWQFDYGSDKMVRLTFTLRRYYSG